MLKFSSSQPINGDIVCPAANIQDPHTRDECNLDIDDIPLTSLRDAQKHLIHIGAQASLCHHVSKYYGYRELLVVNAFAVGDANPLKFANTDDQILLSKETLSAISGIDDVRLLVDKQSCQKVLNIFMHDNSEVDISSIFDLINTNVLQAFSNNLPVYFVCLAGQSRSPTLVTAFLMANCGNLFNSFHAAISYTKFFRSQVNPNFGFILALKNYFSTLRQADLRQYNFSVDAQLITETSISSPLTVVATPTSGVVNPICLQLLQSFPTTKFYKKERTKPANEIDIPLQQKCRN